MSETAPAWLLPGHRRSVKCLTETLLLELLGCLYLRDHPQADRASVSRHAHQILTTPPGFPGWLRSLRDLTGQLAAEPLGVKIGTITEMVRRKIGEMGATEFYTGEKEQAFTLTLVSILSECDGDVTHRQTISAVCDAARKVIEPRALQPVLDQDKHLRDFDKAVNEAFDALRRRVINADTAHDHILVLLGWLTASLCITPFREGAYVDHDAFGAALAEALESYRSGE